jgi:hypothetical protein
MATPQMHATHTAHTAQQTSATLAMQCCKVCSATTGLSACSGCKLMIYCSKACQRIHREDHRVACRGYVELSRTKATMFKCGNCNGPTRVGDYACKCLMTFCSPECRSSSNHERDNAECNTRFDVFGAYIGDKLVEFSEQGDMTEAQINEYATVLYLEARFIEVGACPPSYTLGLARTMFIASAKLGCKSSVIRVGNFTDEELVDGHSRKLTDAMEQATGAIGQSV